MIELDNQTSLQVPEVKLEEITETLTDAPLELIITDDTTIQHLNKAHRNIDKPTDVLSFPLERFAPQMPLGTIIISEPFVHEKAREYGHTEEEELTLLFIHGLLHLLGYDHEADKGEMRDKEEALIREFDLPKSLIVRSQID